MKTTNKSKKIRIMTIVLIILFAVLAALAVIAIVRRIIYQNQLKLQENIYDNLRIEAPSSSSGTVASPIHDFDELAAENPDIYSYITVPGTQVDYPVLQNKERDYYLNRNLELSQGYPACLYTNPENAKDYSDYITVIYGHNMKNKTMFGSLHSYDDEAFFKENNTFEIETRDALYKYQIFAAVNYNDDYIPQYYNVKSYDSVSSFITSMKEEGTKKTPDYFDTENEPSDGDKIVVLSTCIGGQDDRRLLVVGKLVDTVMYSSGSMTN